MARLLLVAAAGLAVAVGLGSAPPAPVEARVQLVSGTLSMSNSKDGAAILTAAGMAPGDSRSGDVTIANTGTLTGTFSLSKSNLSDTPGPTGGMLSSALDLLVQDVTNPVSPATVYAGKVGAMGTRALGNLAPGTSRTYRFTVSLPDGGAPPSPTSGDNAYQSSALSVRFDWTATADEPPSGGGGGTGRGGPAVPAPPAGGPRHPAHQLTLTGKKRQRLVRQRGLVVFVRCTEACSFSATAMGAKAARNIKLSAWRGQVKPGAQVKVKLKLSKKALKAAKRALKRRKRATVTVTVRGTVGAGYPAVGRLMVALR